MKFAIQGHPTRGKEVIQILESLGGKNTSNHNGKDNYAYYISSIDNRIYKTSLLFSEHTHYTLEEFEKEFPFKIGDKVISLTTSLIGTITEFFENGVYHFRYDNGIHSFASASYLKPYKEMKEERNITLTLEKAKEWYKKGGELKEIALQAFTDKELNPLPRSWEEFSHKYKVSDMRYAMPSKYMALWKLEQLRNCWWNDWEPEWSNCEKYVIKWDKNDLMVFTARNIHAFLVFPTREMAEEFLMCFRDLIEKAGDLI